MTSVPRLTGGLVGRGAGKAAAGFLFEVRFDLPAMD
jgi:hypothetical protein